MVNDGLFRDDFLFRLRSFIIELPPLRDRDDIADIAKYYLAKLCERYGIGVKGFSPELMGTLATYRWPGNVREFVHALERALAAAYHEPTLFPQHLPEYIRIELAKHAIGRPIVPHNSAVGESPDRETLPSLRVHRENMDRQYLMELMSLTGGNIKEACRVSGLSRSRLYDLLKYHDVMNSASTHS